MNEKDFEEVKKHLIKQIQDIKYTKGSVLNMEQDFEIDDSTKYLNIKHRLRHTGRVDIRIKYYNPNINR